MRVTVSTNRDHNITPKETPISNEANKANKDSAQQLLVAAVDRVLDELSIAARQTDNNLFFAVVTERMVELFPECRCVAWAGEHKKIPLVSRRGANCKCDAPEFPLLTENVPLSSDTSVVSKTVGTQQILLRRLSSDLLLALHWLQPPSDSGEMLRVRSEVLNEVGNISSEHLATVSAHNPQDSSGEILQLISNCHRTLELKTVSRDLVTGTAKILAADRVWLFDGSTTKRPRLLACSSVSDVDSRSQDLQLVADVAGETLKSGKSTYTSFRDQDNASNTATPTTAYLKHFRSDGICSCLLNTSDQPDVLVAEFFGTHDRIDAVNKLNKIIVAAAPAITNARKHESIPFHKLLARTRAGKSDGIKWRSMATFLALAGLIATFFIPTDFNIPFTGTLRPAQERNVFAPSDGTVSSIAIDYGDTVSVGDTLLKIYSPDYQLKLKQTQGELRSANQQLESQQLLRSQASDSGDELEVAQLTSQIEQVRLKTNSLNEKISFYLTEIGKLNVAAPIDGKIITEKTRQRLTNRPIHSGDKLLTIARVQSDWHAELEIESKEMGYLNSPPDRGYAITFKSLAAIGTEHTGRITNIDGFNSIDENGDVSVRAFVPINKEDFDDLRVGTPITGVVKCGRKSIAFVWTRDIRDFIRTELFWF